MLELSLLGGFDARSKTSAAILLPTRKTRALLAYLALHPDRPVSRETLVGLLWSDRAEPQAHNSLSQAVTALRKALAGVSPQPLSIESGSVTFIGDNARVDALTFEEAIDRGSADDLALAEALYRGDFLDGIGVRDPAFEDWCVFEQERLRARAAGALSRLLQLRAQDGGGQELVATAQKLLKLDPLQETAHRALMRHYLAEGQPGLALRQYDICADLLRRELDVSPEEETKRVRAEIARQRPAGASARETAGAGGTAAGATAASTLAPRAGPAIAGWLMGAAAVAAIAVLAAILLWPGEPGPATPSLVVLPFVNISGDPQQEYFADGMTDELITDLTKLSGLLVIARGTSAAYKGRSMTPGEVAGELSVGYALEGSVRRGGDRVRINVRLIDAETGGNVWAESFDGSLADVIALQDKVAAKIVDSLAVELLPLEAQRLAAADTNNPEAQDAWRLGQYHYYRRTPEDNARAVGYFERAIALDPDYAAAHTALAKAYLQAARGEQAYADALQIFWTQGYVRAWRNLGYSAVRPNADYHVLQSWLGLNRRQHHRAIAEARAALDINPNDADALEALAAALIYGGTPEEGIGYAQQAMDRNPGLVGRPLFLKGVGNFALGKAEQAVADIERAIGFAPESRADFSGVLAAAYGVLGRGQDAKDAFKAYAEGLVNRPRREGAINPQPLVNPRYHTWQRVGLAWAVYAHPFADSAVLERLAEGLRAAGAAEGVGGYLPLVADNRLTGEEIESLLFGSKIDGTSFWQSDLKWSQWRDGAGVVEHSGFPIHPGIGDRASGVSRIDGDLLCERWPALADNFEICVAIFHVPDRKARVRWGDYVMVTDTGPHPFSIAD